MRFKKLVKSITIISHNYKLFEKCTEIKILTDGEFKHLGDDTSKLDSSSKL